MLKKMKALKLESKSKNVEKFIFTFCEKKLHL